MIPAYRITAASGHADCPFPVQMWILWYGGPRSSRLKRKTDCGFEVCTTRHLHQLAPRVACPKGCLPPRAACPQELPAPKSCLPQRAACPKDSIKLLFITQNSNNFGNNKSLPNSDIFNILLYQVGHSCGGHGVPSCILLQCVHAHSTCPILGWHDSLDVGRFSIFAVPL